MAPPPPLVAALRGGFPATGPLGESPEGPFGAALHGMGPVSSRARVGMDEAVAVAVVGGHGGGGYTQVRTLYRASDGRFTESSPDPSIKGRCTSGRGSGGSGGSGAAPANGETSQDGMCSTTGGGDFTGEMNLALYGDTAASPGPEGLAAIGSQSHHGPLPLEEWS
jgi:hypothetical protein